jgi:ketosteroid isomerase-like protein
MKTLRPVLMIVLVLMPLADGCSKETEEDRVKKVITSVQKAAEEKKISAVLDHVSKNYLDPQGNDYNGIKGLLAFYFFRHQKVSVYMPNVDIVVTGQTAKAQFQAILTGRGTGESAGGVLPEALGAYTFDVLFNKENGQWRVTSAKWERAGEGTAPPQ